ALTGTERFERLSIAIFNRTKSEEETVRSLESALEGRVPMQPETRAAAEKERNEANAALAAIHAKVAEREFHIGWFRRLHELTTARDQASASLSNARQLLHESAPRRQYLDRVAQAAAE